MTFFMLIFIIFNNYMYLSKLKTSDIIFISLEFIEIRNSLFGFYLTVEQKFF